MYLAEGWCGHGEVKKSWVTGSAFNFPEVNCCICGGGTQSKTAAKKVAAAAAAAVAPADARGARGGAEDGGDEEGLDDEEEIPITGIRLLGERHSGTNML